MIKIHLDDKNKERKKNNLNTHKKGESLFDIITYLYNV